MRVRSVLRLAAPFVCAALAVAQEQALFLHLQRAAAKAPLVVAHRGASSDHPENTVAALRAAVDVGAEVVEFDVWQARCGTWVCMHDATVDRTTDAATVFGKKEIRIDSLTRAEIGRLDAGRWRDPKFAGERVPTLEEALAAIGSAVPMVERKGGDPQALVAELRRLRAVDRVLVQAFDWEWLAAVHRAEPRLLLGALGGKEPTSARLAEAAHGRPARALGPPHARRRCRSFDPGPGTAPVRLHRRSGPVAARCGGVRLRPDHDERARTARRVARAGSAATAALSGAWRRLSSAAPRPRRVLRR